MVTESPTELYEYLRLRWNTNNVFHEHLGIKTISCRWVRHDLTDTQKQCVE
jgi:hypothetical protein